MQLAFKKVKVDCWMTLFFQLIPRYVTVMLYRYILRNQRLIKMRIDKVAFELYSRILHADKEGRLTIDQHRNVGRYRKLRGQVVMWGYNLPPLVHIGLTNLLKPGWAIVYPAHPSSTSLNHVIIDHEGDEENPICYSRLRQHDYFQM